VAGQGDAEPLSLREREGPVAVGGGRVRGFSAGRKISVVYAAFPDVVRLTASDPRRIFRRDGVWF
jgi:hypothetical protein